MSRESRCNPCTLDVQQRSRDAMVILVQRMSRDVIVVHEMINGGVEMLSRSRDAITVHEMFNGGVEMLSLYMRCLTKGVEMLLLYIRCSTDESRKKNDDLKKKMEDERVDVKAQRAADIVACIEHSMIGWSLLLRIILPEMSGLLNRIQVNQRFSGQVYGGPGEVVAFPAIVVVFPVSARMKRRWLLSFSGEGCSVSGKVFYVSGNGCCDSGGEDKMDTAIGWRLRSMDQIYSFVL
ncbi:hypothetical protein Tco_0991003 [Tanacetum coccineum]|uniref:Uncharacterized protein n=1 Tax=Tanacetum coccineum TaxID=301880 RepID=A0ABQ5EYF4_9ASTR